MLTEPEIRTEAKLRKYNKQQLQAIIQKEFSSNKSPLFVKETEAECVEQTDSTLCSKAAIIERALRQNNVNISRTESTFCSDAPTPGNITKNWAKIPRK